MQNKTAQQVGNGNYNQFSFKQDLNFWEMNQIGVRIMKKGETFDYEYQDKKQVITVDNSTRVHYYQILRTGRKRTRINLLEIYIMERQDSMNVVGK